MSEAIYTIRICGKDINIDRMTWNAIRDHARNYKPFYLVYNGEKYKYVKHREFYDRPTRFDFEHLNDEEEGIIKYIYINECVI